MSNFVESFWRSKYAEPLTINIDGEKFERMAMNQAQIDNVISNDDYEQALHDAADFGLSYAGKRIYDNETMKAQLDEFWNCESMTSDMRLQLGIEVAEISGISMDIGIIKSEQEEREAKELAALEEAEMVAVINGDSEEVQNLDPSVTIEEFAEDNLHAEQITTHP